MKVFHLNCGTLCPFTGPLLSKKIPLISENFCLCCHCVLIETTEDGLILIDTGLGIQDVQHKRSIFDSYLFKQFSKPLLDINETAYYQIKRLGYHPSDVKHIVATHFDADHIGGLSDFTKAKVHVWQDEYDAAVRPKSLNGKARYKKNLWQKTQNFVFYKNEGENWKDFKNVQKLKLIKDDISIVPLKGHTEGHCGVHYRNGNCEEFMVGDSYMNRKQLLEQKVPAWVKLYNKTMHSNFEAFELNLHNLQKLNKREKNLQIFCSHDMSEFRKNTRDSSPC